MLHKNIPIGDIHYIHNWEVANAAALAALVVTSADKGKLAWQQDTNEFYFLANHIGPVWVGALGVGGPRGDQGLSILHGIVAPTTQGIEGEFYIDTATSTIYGPKGPTAWPTGVSLVGANGIDGVDGIDGIDGISAIGLPIGGTSGQILEKIDSTDYNTQWVDKPALPNKVIPIACSDEATAILAGVAKVTFRMPFAMTLTAVRASLSVAQTTGTLVTIDINSNGATILSTKITLDNTEKTSTTAATPSVISNSALADDAEITIDIDAVGGTTAKGLKIYLIGT